MKSRTRMAPLGRITRMRRTLAALALAAVCLGAALSGCVGEIEMTSLDAVLDSTVIRRDPGTYKIVTPLPSGGQIFYTLYIPNSLPTSGTVPLVVAAHFGGQVTTWYGGAFADLLVIPSFDGMGAIIVAPDAGRIGGWNEQDEPSVMWLAREIARVYPVDRRKVVMTGYSAGGSQTWLLANHNQDFFTAAIPVSARPRQNESPWRIPIYVIHSRNDDVIPFDSVQGYVSAQQAIGARIQLTALTGMTHYQTVEFIPALRETQNWLREIWPR